MKRRHVAIAIMATFALAACSAPEKPEPTGTPITVGPGSTVEPVSVAPPTTTAPATPDVVTRNLGESVTAPGGEKITVYDVKQRIPYDKEPDGTGQAWFGIDVQLCTGAQAPDASWFSDFNFGWTLDSEQGWVLDTPSSSWDDIVQPPLDLYGKTPKVDTCYRGWVLIDGPADATVTSANFENAAWTVPPER